MHLARGSASSTTDGDSDNDDEEEGGRSPSSVSRAIIYESHYRDAPRPETFSNGVRGGGGEGATMCAGPANARFSESMYRQISDYRRDAVVPHTCSMFPRRKITETRL